MEKLIKKLFITVCVNFTVAAAALSGCIISKAATIPGLENNRYITLSPDGQAFTIGYRDKTNQNYSSGEIGKTITAHGMVECVQPGEGEHIYKDMIYGTVPVGYWKLGWTQGKCIHSAGANFRINSLNLMGANNHNCYRNYNAGWVPYCAVCGEKVANIYFYMTEDMAQETKYLPSGIPSATYFYLCPYDNSLENHNYIRHVCTQISTNRYTIEYCGAGEDVLGSMEDDIFYYEPGEKYEGKAVTMKENLSLCEFVRENYRFAGWSTKYDGEAQISDGENWLTVREVVKAAELSDNSVIKLYAVWEPDETGENVISKDRQMVTDLELETDIERVLFDTDGEEAFLRGESGDLNISVSGDPDSVTVEFPKGLEEYDRTFDYLGTENDSATEKIRFIVPIDGIDEDTDMLTVRVSAYRGDESVCSYPVIILRENGSVLNELRTSLR